MVIYETRPNYERNFIQSYILLFHRKLFWSKWPRVTQDFQVLHSCQKIQKWPTNHYGNFSVIFQQEIFRQVLMAFYWNIFFWNFFTLVQFVKPIISFMNCLVALNSRIGVQSAISILLITRWVHPATTIEVITCPLARSEPFLKSETLGRFILTTVSLKDMCILKDAPTTKPKTEFSITEFRFWSNEHRKNILTFSFRWENRSKMLNIFKPIKNH